MRAPASVLHFPPRDASSKHRGWTMRKPLTAEDEITARPNQGLPPNTGSGGAAERERALPPSPPPPLFLHPPRSVFGLKNAEMHRSLTPAPLSLSGPAGSVACFVYITEVLSPAKVPERAVGEGIPQTSYPHFGELHHSITWNGADVSDERPRREEERGSTLQNPFLRCPPPHSTCRNPRGT